MGKKPHAHGIAATIRKRVFAKPDAYWKVADFKDLSAPAVTKTFGRLNDDGLVQRVAKGLYYVPASTVFGSSVPTGPDIAAYAGLGTLHPAGLSAANVLGLTTQNSAYGEYATTRSSPPLLLKGARVLTNRSFSREALTRREGAMLEVLRTRARDADVDADVLRQRLINVLKAPGAFSRVAIAAADEPPRVRAMLGALAAQAGLHGPELAQLRSSLNPLSRFDFGPLRGLRHAREWQAA